MIGLKGMFGGALINPSDSYTGNQNTNYGMGFFSGTITVVNKRVTGFGQVNFGNNAIGGQIGIQYQIQARWRHKTATGSFIQ